MLRSQVNQSDRESYACTAVQLLTSHPVFESSRHIACYYASDREFATLPFMKAIWQSNKVCYLPIITEQKSLLFAEYNEGDELQSNQFMIPEPVGTKHIIHPDKLDLVLLPLLAYDNNGGRLGMGGGYYDRAFSFVHDDKLRDKPPCLVGLGYSLQYCDNICSESWDVELNGVLNEKEFITF